MKHIAIAAASLAAVGVGVGWASHPGWGLAVAGGLLWIDLVLAGAGK